MKSLRNTCCSGKCAQAGSEEPYTCTQNQVHGSSIIDFSAVILLWGLRVPQKKRYG